MKVDGVQHGGKHQGALEQGCTGVHRVNNGRGGVRRSQKSNAHGRRGSGKECTWSEGVGRGRRGVREAMESWQGVSEVLGAGPGKNAS
jgi:hypothetical protein